MSCVKTIVIRVEKPGAVKTVVINRGPAGPAGQGGSGEGFALTTNEW